MEKLMEKSVEKSVEISLGKSVEKNGTKICEKNIWKSESSVIRNRQNLIVIHKESLTLSLSIDINLVI